MDRQRSISKRLFIITIGGATCVGVVSAAVLVPMKLNGLLPSHYGWPKVVAGPFLCFYLLSGAVVPSLICDRLGVKPFSAISIVVALAYLGVMVFTILVIEACS